MAPLSKPKKSEARSPKSPCPRARVKRCETRNPQRPAGSRSVVGRSISVKSGSDGTNGRSGSPRSICSTGAGGGTGCAGAGGGGGGGSCAVAGAATARHATSPSTRRSDVSLKLPSFGIDRALGVVVRADLDRAPVFLLIRQQMVMIAACLDVVENGAVNRLARVEHDDVARRAVGVEVMRVGLHLMRTRVGVGEAHALR